jgi:hypothetical protein
MVSDLIKNAKDVKEKLKLHVENVTNEHINNEIEGFEKEFYNIKNISEIVLTLNENKLHDSLIYLIKNNKLNVISIFSKFTLLNCDELLKAIIYSMKNNLDIDQTIILELVFPFSYDTEYLDEIHSLSNKNSKISFFKGIQVKPPAVAAYLLVYLLLSSIKCYHLCLC